MSAIPHPIAPDANVRRTAPDPDGTTYPYDVTIGLICYRDCQMISDLVATVEASDRRYKYEWLLSDNGSTDGTREMVRKRFPYVKVLENGRNLGVAAGRNRIFWNSRAKYTMILDADTLVHNGAIDTLVDSMEENPQIGIAAPKLVYRNGDLQLSSRRFPKLHHTLIEGTSFRRFFEWTGIPARVDMRHVNHDSAMTVDCVYGAAMLIRNCLTRQLGGFDEGYFYLYEDYDLCHRFHRAGYPVMYQPNAQVTHFYEREEQGMFHPRMKSHIRSILRFQTRNMWRISRMPVVLRSDLDGDNVPKLSKDRSVAGRF